MIFPDDPRIYLAAERTLLAWTRTGLALIGFGAVLGRQLLGVIAAYPDVAVILGVVLCGLGTVGNFFALIQYVAIVKRIPLAERPRLNAVAVPAIIASAIGLLGLVLTASLIFS